MDSHSKEQLRLWCLEHRQRKFADTVTRVVQHAPIRRMMSIGQRPSALFSWIMLVNTASGKLTRRRKKLIIGITDRGQMTSWTYCLLMLLV